MNQQKQSKIKKIRKGNIDKGDRKKTIILKKFLLNSLNEKILSKKRQRKNNL